MSVPLNLFPRRVRLARDEIEAEEEEEQARVGGSIPRSHPAEIDKWRLSVDESEIFLLVGGKRNPRGRVLDMLENRPRRPDSLDEQLRIGGFQQPVADHLLERKIDLDLLFLSLIHI